MGFHRKNIKYFEEITEFLGYKTFQGMRLCQLGDSYVRRDAKQYLSEIKNLDYTKLGRASDYYRKLEIEVITIDLGIGPENVRSDVLKYDLCKPITDIGEFDFVVDLGTGEHVEDQFELFRNIHNLCKVNGIIIRCNPSIRWGSPHGFYYYTFLFYQKLAHSYDYKILDISEGSGKYGPKMRGLSWKHCIFVTLRKNQDNEFLRTEWDPVGAEIGKCSIENCEKLKVEKVFR